jgi:nucleoside-triphosphatase
MQDSRTLFLTGLPGVGKSTVVRHVAGAVRGLRVEGFITDEIRVHGRRVGFQLAPLHGKTRVLAHVDLDSPHRVGRYGVDVRAVDEVVGATLETTDGADLYLIDEIGKMECFSCRFVSAVEQLLNLGHLLVATIHRDPGGFAGRIKRRPDTDLWEITRGNRDDMASRVLSWIEAATGTSQVSPASLRGPGSTLRFR